MSVPVKGQMCLHAHNIKAVPLSNQHKASSVVRFLISARRQDQMCVVFFSAYESALKVEKHGGQNRCYD